MYDPRDPYNMNSHRKQKRLNKSDTMFKIGIGFFVLLVVAGISLAVAGLLNETERVCTVTSKESVRVEEGNQYRVYTEECGTLQVTDTLLKMRFDSADTYGSLKEGETYQMTTIGFRIPFLSQFPNILEAK